ncbi:Differentiation-associated protein 1, putative isoform 1 [Quillaja saponaria]|uniref:Differentiation-associated protein 1, putative isoform 1 n=1 Tax=Quillaja saponaria TaxID=32244 RepID=A0AAD7LKH4_QUISA|nr:Differentiation-associated protein 1, putative isoform 1 [Quillaja saponaria]
MAISLNTVIGFNSMLQVRYQNVARSPAGASLQKTIQSTSCLVTSGSRVLRKEKRWGLCLSMADSDQLAADTSGRGTGNGERSLADDQLSNVNPPVFESSSGDGQFQANVDVESTTSKDTISSTDQKQGSAESTYSQSVNKRSLTARERLRAARVLSRYTESKETKSDTGSKFLDALKESDRGKKRSRLPEAPTNLFDDSKRGMPKQGLTFQFPGGFDLFVIVFSFVFISTVMFATTYFVWKVGAIHFNEY